MGDGATKLYNAQHAQIYRRIKDKPATLPFEACGCMKFSNSIINKSHPPSSSETPDESKAKRKKQLEAVFQRRREIYRHYYRKLQSQPEGT